MGREKFSIAAFKKFANSSNLIRFNEKQNLNDSSQYFAGKKNDERKKKIYFSKLN